MINLAGAEGDWVNRPLILLLCKLRVLRTLHLISANLKLYRYGRLEVSKKYI